MTSETSTAPSASAFESFTQAITDKLGSDSITTNRDTLQRYGEHTLPSADNCPAAVVYPRSTDHVQKLVQAANQYRVELFPISTGQNIGLGTKSPMHTGQVVVDLGRHMNKILEINETLGYCVVEPGVSFQAMYDELQKCHSRLMMSPTAGPPQGSLLGNALDKGGGGGAAADHFGMSCGMEIVLGNGQIVRTGDGSLRAPEHLNWHVSKYSFGPALDGLFTQSNYGIVTSIGIWMMARPPHIEPFFFAADDDDDLEEIIELVRPLKQTNFVPTQIRVTNDLYLISSADVNPEYSTTNGTQQISDQARRALQQKHRLGSWNISGALFGASQEALEPQMNRLRAHFRKSSKIRYIPPEEAQSISPLNIARKNYAGIPSDGELRMLNWRPGGGTSWFLPGTPMIGEVANSFQRSSREICKQYGLEYMASNVCGPRFARGVHTLIFNRNNPDEAARADACYRALSDSFAKRGVFIGRAPTMYQQFHQDQRMPAIADACSAIKQALDPNGVIAPGKYGIR
ncbi:MAG: FAD-binding oxidoreductase [Advenella sp.]|uniref:FAD-binding oxidoreductase n=1 Tax=Advenella sp. TaxID=1872388 RepID=UPI003F9E82AA